MLPESDHHLKNQIVCCCARVANCATLNGAQYPSQLWMWINITSVLWMALCLAVLVGSGVAVSPWVPVAVLVVPLVLAVLNSSKGMVVSFCYLTVAAVPFVLLTAVNSVLVFLYAMATLDR